MIEYLVAGGVVTTKGALGILISLGIENYVTAAQAYYCYNLISIAIILFIAAMSGPRSETAFCIVVPIFAGLFMYFGWLRLATASQTQGLFYLTVILGLLGVLMYMNEQNRVTYGSVGPGSKLFNIAVFLALFGASLSLISGFSILDLGQTQSNPGTCVVGLPCDANNNFDFQTMKGSMGEAGTLNIGNAMGWMVEKGLSMAIVLINVLVGVFAFPYILNQTMEGIAPGISTNAMWLLTLSIIELSVVFIYAISIYEFFTKAPAGSTL